MKQVKLKKVFYILCNHGDAAIVFGFLNKYLFKIMSFELVVPAVAPGLPESLER